MITGGFPWLLSKTRFQKLELGKVIYLETAKITLGPAGDSPLYRNLGKEIFLGLNNGRSAYSIFDKDYDRIFKRFFRVDKDRSRETGGSGLGLSIAKNVILKHDGNIEVESEINKGTTFIITLPIKK